MKAFVILGLLCLLSRPAGAMSCDEVRSYVQMYGASAVLAYAQRVGVTSEEIRQGRACLGRAHAGQRRRFGRAAHTGWASN